MKIVPLLCGLTLLRMFGRDSVAVVGDHKLKFAATFAQPQAEDTTRREGIQGIDDYVGNDLQYLARVHVCNEFLRQFFYQAHSFS